jgi:hypothetical protein
LWVVEDWFVHREIRVARRVQLRLIVCSRLPLVNAASEGLRPSKYDAKT